MKRDLSEDDIQLACKILREHPIKKQNPEVVTELSSIIPKEVLERIFGGLVVYTPRIWNQYLDLIISFYQPMIGDNREINREDLSRLARESRRRVLGPIIKAGEL